MFSTRHSQSPSILIFVASIVLILASAVLANVPSTFGRHDGFYFNPVTTRANYTSDEELHKRDLTWQQAIDDGQAILAQLVAGGQQSRWSTVQQLKDNGWTISANTEEYSKYYYGKKDGPYDSLHIEQSAGSRIVAEQNIPFKNCHSDNVKETGGKYDNVYNVVGKTIVGTYNYSPVLYASRTQEIVQHKKVTDLAPYIPDVYKLSDVQFIVWADQCRQQGAQPNVLRYIFKHDVVTFSTKNIMRIAAGLEPELEEKQGQGEDLSAAWPGLQFSPDSQQFKALMGTPHGKGVAYLILQHRNEMPTKNIESITVFTTSNDLDYDLLFTLTEQ
ncbi:MAG: hypothetical protein Q9212_003628 [Teloschistes hypoglaucus]